MKLYYFPSPNPQKVRFALNELGLDCETIPVDLTKGEHSKPEFLALNPCGRVPVLADGDIILSESHAILAYLGEKTEKMWPTSAAGRADALKWMFFLSQHISPPTTEVVFNRIAVKVLGIKGDKDAIVRGEKALPRELQVLEGRLAKTKWILGDAFTLVDCAYGPTLNALEKADFNFGDYPKMRRYLEAIRERPAWKETPKVPGL
jgi:glutathione S-transferase